MRGSNNDTPVLILTAQDDLSDRVKAWMQAQMII